MGQAFAQSGQGIVLSVDRFGPSFGPYLGSLFLLFCVAMMFLAIKLSFKKWVWRKNRRWY